MSAIGEIPEGNFSQLKAVIITELRGVATGLKGLADECKENQEKTREYIDKKFTEWKEIDDTRHAAVDKKVEEHAKEITDLKGKIGLRGALVTSIPLLLVLIPLLYKVFWAGD